MSLNLAKSITSEKRLEEMLEEAEAELEKIQPQIEKLEKQADKLRQLKLAKQKLITLKLSLKSILENFSKNKVEPSILLSGSPELRNLMAGRESSVRLSTSQSTENASKIFLPDLAFSEVDRILRKKTSMNYEIFRAIVFNGGKATTEQIKAYLVENGITQPTTGEGFENVELTDISSRTNYLVRKGLVSPDGRGLFISNLGWIKEDDQGDPHPSPLSEGEGV